MENTAINRLIENYLILKIQNNRKNFHQDIRNNNNIENVRGRYFVPY